MILSEEIDIQTSKRLEIVDITSKISEIVKKSDINQGLLNVFTRHSTSAIVINENEPRLVKDFENLLMRIVPENENYGHNVIDNNADSHLRSFLLGGSQSIPIIDSSLDLGTWQSIFFIELDGPRNRKVKITLIS